MSAVRIARMALQFRDLHDPNRLKASMPATVQRCQHDQPGVEGRPDRRQLSRSPAEPVAGEDVACELGVVALIRDPRRELRRVGEHHQADDQSNADRDPEEGAGRERRT